MSTSRQLVLAAALLLAAPRVALAQGVEIESPTPPPPAAAAPAGHTDHTFGLGFGETPVGLAALEAEYYLGGSLMLDGMLGFASFSPKSGNSTTVLGLGGALFYRWKVMDDVSFMIGGRLEVEHLSVGSGPGSTATQVNIEMPLRAQIYFASYLAVHAEVAAVLALVTDDGGGFLGGEPVDKGTYLAIPLSNLVGDFGATFYFP